MAKYHTTDRRLYDASVGASGEFRQLADLGKIDMLQPVRCLAMVFLQPHRGSIH